MSPKPAEHPPLRRVAYHDHANAAAAARLPHNDNPGQVAHEATRLEPFQKIQVESDQLFSHAESVRRGDLFDFAGGFKGYAADALAHMDRLATTLEIAAAAARSHVNEVHSQVKGLVSAMDKKKADDHPKLTTDGSPHPLEEGGYDALSDPQLSQESDVAALKSGHATQAQAEAIAKSDLAHNDEKADPGADHADDADPDDARPKPKGHAHKDKPKDKDKGK